MINSKRLLETFLALIEIDGKSGNERKIANYIKNFFVDYKIPVYEDNAALSFGGNAGNIIATLKGDANLSPIFICAHMDTIQSTLGIKPIIENEVVFTDRSTILGADDRAGVAIILETVNTIIQNKINTPTIYFVFTVCEEAGMFGSKNLDFSSMNCQYGFVIDSSAEPGSVIVSAPSALQFKIRIFGKAAHAAVHPEEGINAISISGQAISKIKVGRVSNTCTLNLGTIKGGSLINVVPADVEIVGEVRSFVEEEIRQQLKLLIDTFKDAAKYFGGKIEFSTSRKYYGFNLDIKSPVVNAATSAINKASLPVNCIVYPGGSDANIFNHFGFPTVNLGIGYKKVHSLEESISIKNLERTADIVFNIVSN